MVRIDERVAILENEAEHTKGKLDEHSKMIKSMDKALVSIVHEVKLIRLGIFLLAGALSYTPGKDIILQVLKQLL